MDVNRKAGSLFGMALGDALGAHTEFLRVDQILKKISAKWPTGIIG